MHEIYSSKNSGMTPFNFLNTGVSRKYFDSDPPQKFDYNTLFNYLLGNIKKNILI